MISHNTNVVMEHCAIYSVLISHFLNYGVVNGQDIPQGATVCKTGYGYPFFCPRPGDSPEHTKCCRHYYTPKCCRERATQVCAASKSSKMGRSNWDPDLTYAAVWCPQDDQSDDHTACQYSDGQIGCMSYKVVIGIIAGIFGAIFLILVAIGIACFVCYKKGKLKCVKVRPGKWTLKRVEQQHSQQRQQDYQQQQQQQQLQQQQQQQQHHNQQQNQQHYQQHFKQQQQQQYESQQQLQHHPRNVYPHQVYI